jgi:hypothetical protein
VNQSRGFLIERGITVRQGPAPLRKALPQIPHPLIDDTFVTRDLAQARELLAMMTQDEAERRIRDRLADH